MDSQDNGDALRRTQWECSVDMLRAVVRGQSYDAVAAAQGISRTAVERRIKTVAALLVARAEIQGLNAQASHSIKRLRLHRDAVLRGLEALEHQEAERARPVAILSDADIAAGALRIRGRSRQPLEDVAMYYLLFATGARPLEIARLLVRDYLRSDGSVRQCSEIRDEVSTTGRSRPLLFASAHLRDALDAHLAERLAAGRGLGATPAYRGLAPDSRLFLSPTGTGYAVAHPGEDGERRLECRAIWHHYRMLFRHAQLTQVTALTARRTVAERLYARGADEDQIGLLFGIVERRAVHAQFPRRPPTLQALLQDLV